MDKKAAPVQRQETEFQAIILAGGPGGRMYPLTTEIAKPLLPIANRPMLSYQLEFLSRSGFTDVIVIAQESASEQLTNFVEEVYEGEIKVTWEFLKDFMGTAEALLHIKSKISQCKSVLLISGDLVVDPKFLVKMADKHRSKDSVLTALVYAPENVEQSSDIGLKDYIGLEEDTSRLIYFKAVADVENTMKLPKKLLRKYPNLTIHTELVDAHLYIINANILINVLERETHLLSIKGELVPFLVRSQFMGKFREECKVKRSQELAYTMTSSKIDTKDVIRCFVHILDKDCYCARANTTQNYITTNKQMATRNACYKPYEPLVKNNYIHPAAKISPQTSIGIDCVVGEGSEIGDRCSIKKSVIGKHCRISDKVKIINSIIMNHVTIATGCVINNSVVCDDVDMQTNCNIKDSHVGVAFPVSKDTDLRNGQLSREVEEAVVWRI